MGIKRWKKTDVKEADGMINQDEGTSERRRTADLELLPSSHLLLLLFLQARLQSGNLHASYTTASIDTWRKERQCVCVCELSTH